MSEHNRHKHEVESIKKMAYELWEKDGRKEGHDSDYYLSAEKTIKAQIKK